MGRRKKSRYAKVDPSKVDQSCVELRKEFPAKLVDVFVALHDSDYGDKEYRKYQKQAELFLGDKAKDAIEDGKLIVRLAKATFDMVKEATDGKVKAKGKAKGKDEAKEAT